MRLRTLLTTACALALTASSLAFTPTKELELLATCAAMGGHPAPEETTVTSQADGIEIDITIFRPICASAADPVPVILHSHGWSGTKSTSGFSAELDAGFGVVSITQRGHGDTGGQARVQDPEFEAQDIKSVIDHVATLDWVAKDRDANGEPITNDPVLFAMGGSYGGAYQTITALTEIRESGSTRFNALAPEITWFDLPHSLAPNDIVRSEWNEVLYATGAALVDLHPLIHRSFAYGAATGEWPDGTILGQDDATDQTPDLDSFFHAHSPTAFVADGHHLDIPVLWRQGTNDTLFNLNEGLHNFQQTLTDDARRRSVFVAYNGGHVLPTAYPSIRADEPLGGTDACSFSGFGDLRLAFFTAVVDGVASPAAALRGQHPALRRYNLTTDDSRACVRSDHLPDLSAHPAGEDVDLVVEQIEDGWTTTTGAGAATHVEIQGLEGPATITGIPVLTGQVAAVGVDQRAFFGISRGTSPADAQLVQAQLMPLRVLTPSANVTEPFELELAGIAVELQEGEKLFLTVTPFSEQFHGHGSARTPGWLGFTDLEVHLPVAR